MRQQLPARGWYDQKMETIHYPPSFEKLLGIGLYSVSKCDVLNDQLELDSCTGPSWATCCKAKQVCMSVKPIIVIEKSLQFFELEVLALLTWNNYFDGESGLVVGDVLCPAMGSVGLLRMLLRLSWLAWYRFLLIDPRNIFLKLSLFSSSKKGSISTRFLENRQHYRDNYWATIPWQAQATLKQLLSWRVASKLDELNTKLIEISSVFIQRLS